MMTTITVPPGSYYLGDPCYSIQDDEWFSSVKNMYDESGNFVDGKIIKISNGILMSFSTTGDGSYYDEQNNMYPVDSSTIGLVSVDHNPECTLTDLVRIVDFAEETVCTYDGEKMIFGEIVIDTTKYPWNDEEDSYVEY